MKKTLLVLFAVAFASAHCFADDVELAGKLDAGRAGGEHLHGAWCKLNLTDEQKTKMRAERFKFEESKIDLEAQLKHSRLAFKKLLTDPSGDYSAAKSAAKEVANNLSKLIASKEAFKAEMAFKVLTAEQRQEAEKCHHWHGHRPPQFGHGSDHRMGMEEGSDAGPQHEEVSMLDDEDME